MRIGLILISSTCSIGGGLILETCEPMHLDKICTYTAFDNPGETILSKSFEYIEKGDDLLGSIKNSRPLNRCYTFRTCVTQT